MSNEADQIRAEIERTRSELGSDVDALADKVTPSKIVHRQGDKLKGALGSVKDQVMGVAGDVRDTVSDATSSAGAGVAHAPDKAIAKAKGNPLAVGLIAFGVGALVASLIPASEKEKEIATSVKDKAEPVIAQATEAAKDVAEHLKEPAQQAAASVKDAATEAVDTVKSEASAAAEDVTDSAKHAKDDVQRQASSTY